MIEMMRKNKKILLVLVIVNLFMFSCKKIERINFSTRENLHKTIDVKGINENNKYTSKFNIYKHKNYGGIFLNISIDDFNKIGYEYGDSVDIEFSNGYKIEDVPYFDGYYSKPGEIILLSYVGNEDVKVCFCHGDDLWYTAKVKNTDTVNISLREKGKYVDIQNLLKLKYSNNRNDYVSDEVFANFRSVNVGNLKDNILYRGASPINNKYKRAKFVDKIINKVNIEYDIDLSDNVDNVKKYFSSSDFDSKYFESLYNNSKVDFFDMDTNFKSEKLAKKVINILIDMSINEGPFFVHCVEGKDRTGFVCILIEGLAGATYEEIINDYMISYKNYYGIDKVSDEKRYNLIKSTYADSMLRFLADYNNSGNNDIELKDLEWNSIVARYLIDKGMSIDDLDNWYNNVTK